MAADEARPLLGRPPLAERHAGQSRVVSLGVHDPEAGTAEPTPGRRSIGVRTPGNLHVREPTVMGHARGRRGQLPVLQEGLVRRHPRALRGRADQDAQPPAAGTQRGAAISPEVVERLPEIQALDVDLRQAYQREVRSPLHAARLRHVDGGHGLDRNLQQNYVDVRHEANAPVLLHRVPDVGSRQEARKALVSDERSRADVIGERVSR